MSDPTWLSPLLAAPFVGSFLGVLIQRLPAGRPVVFARSRCDHCGHALSAIELVPLASFALQRGRCRACRTPIGWFPPAVELAALAIAAWAATATGGAELWVSCLLGWVLLGCAWVDLRTMLLPDVLTVPLLVAGLAVTAFNDPDALMDHALAAAAGYLALAGLAHLYRVLRGHDGLGLGDAKLLAALGAWVGIALLPFIVFAAACLGLVAALGLRLAGRTVHAQTPLPFGPCLALMGWLAWLYLDPGTCCLSLDDLAFPSVRN